jgi:hypothetical protein
VSQSSQFHRRLRKQVNDALLSADVVADVNIVVSTGDGTANAHQDSPITQSRRRPASPSPEQKENP